jgi:hypothetical protein
MKMEFATGGCIITVDDEHGGKSVFSGTARGDPRLLALLKNRHKVSEAGAKKEGISWCETFLMIQSRETSRALQFTHSILLQLFGYAGIQIAAPLQ